MERKILTTEGYLKYSRYVLRPSDSESASKLQERDGSKTVVPLDCVMGVNRLPFKVSAQMMVEIAYWAAKLSSYQDAEDFLARTKGIRVSDDTVREVTNHVGSIVYNDDCAKADECRRMMDECRINNDEAQKEGTLYLMTDGAAVNTRTKDENNSTWRENKLAVAFSDDNIHFWTDGKGQRQHRIEKREYATLIGTAQEFKYHFLALALRNGYGKYKKTAIISDGATWIRNIKDEMFPDAQQILDLFHLKENTYEFAKDIFNNDESRYRPWAEQTCKRLESGEWQAVLDELEKYKGRPSKPGCVNLYTYISNNKNNIDYPSYKKQGLFVGSGAIESGNKVVLQNRLKLPGMRWNVQTAQYILSLKAKLESSLWDSKVVPLILDSIGKRGK